jgi:hypothetical protein
MNDVFDIDGAELLDRVRDWLGTYISTVSDSDLDLLTLWAIHTHVVIETYTTPRLQIDSPIHGSGKTTVIEHLERLCNRSIQMATISSPTMLTRMLDKEIRTILIDEADRSLAPQKEGYADLMAVLNSGYKRGSTRPTLVPTKGGGWDVKEMPTFAPVALAGNNPTLPDDTRSRIIRVLLMPDHSGLLQESNWEEIEDGACALHDDIAAWADQVREHVKRNRPDLPDGITGRFREKWSPLKRVADAAGGDWAKRTDEMALNDKKEWEMDREDGLLREKPAVVLLRHINEVWPADTAFWPSEELVRQLIWEYPQMWGAENPFRKNLTTKRLATMLVTGYKIHSDQPVRGERRGYHRSAFTRAWQRMRVEPASDTSDSSHASDAERGTPQSDAEVLKPTCVSCGRKLMMPISIQEGICESCRLHADEE